MMIAIAIVRVSTRAMNTALDYIKTYNGSSESYFADYKGGTVSIVNNETDEYVYNETIK